MGNLLRRSFSGIIFVLIFVSSILVSKESYIVLTSLFALLGIWEFSKMIDFKSFVSYIFFGLVLFLMLKRPESYAITGVLIITILSSVFLIYQLFAKKEILFFNDRSKLGLTIRYLIFSMSFLVLLPFYKGEYNPYLMICILVLIWVNDSFAFLVGKNIGKTKLFVSVSPKKTIEGFVGGVVFAIIAAFTISKYNTDFTLLNWIVIAVIVSVIGTIGDLVESKFKRQANIKDSGTIMPGHGGILDRLDSLLFAAPFVYMYINFIIYDMIRFHKEGYKIIVIAFVLSIAGILLAEKFIEIGWLLKVIQVIILAFLIIVLQFFRNPKRLTNLDANTIIAPVDGKVVVIEEVEEPEYFKDKRLQVSIFMSPINVHVTRYAMSGVIKYSKYHPGKYLVAWHPKASTENERTTVVLKNEAIGEVLYRQIAGALAKRIVNYAKEGDTVVQGTDAGFIKFGSRVDLYLPLGTKLNVKLGDKVKGGVQVVAEK